MDNIELCAPAHKAAVAKAVIREFVFETLEGLLYDLAP